ncbi:MAG: hypothetical protein ACK5LL_08245 [Suipraeoptans sp.]
MIYFQLLFVLFYGLLTDLNLPKSTRFITDIITIVLFILVITSKEKTGLTQYKMIIGSMILWYIFMVIFALFKSPDFMQIIWASRNWIRFFLFLIACLTFLDNEDIKRIIKCLNYIYVFNFILLGIQFATGLRDDHLGGIFGSEVGANGSTNIFICGILILHLAESVVKKRFSNFAIFTLVSSMTIAALAEIKVFYYEFIFIVFAVLILSLFKSKGIRKVHIQIGISAICAFAIGMIMIINIYPDRVSVLTGNASIERYEEATEWTYQISRTKAIPQINELFFGDDIQLKLTGYGFGNCEYSNIAAFRSGFYDEFGNLNYIWFSHQLLYLEGGLIGLGLYILIYISFLAYSFRRFLRKSSDNHQYIFGIVFSAIVLINVFYNNDLRSDIAYLIFFFLAAGVFDYSKNKQEK